MNKPNMLDLFKNVSLVNPTPILYISLQLGQTKIFADLNMSGFKSSDFEGVKIFLPVINGDFHEFSLSSMLKKYNSEDFITSIGGRYYLKKDAAPEGIKELLNEIPWLKDLHRSAIHEISIEHVTKGFGINRDQVIHKSNLAIMFHRDHETLEELIEQSTFQLSSIPSHQQRKYSKDTSEGSAFAFKNLNKILLGTARHVTEGKAKRFLISHSKMKSFYASVSELHSHDIQILELEKQIEIPTLILGNSDILELTDKLYVAGYPHKLGERPTLSLGHVSKLNATYGEETGLIQISSAAINPKNSGGPVLNEKGEVVGILTTRGTKDDGLQNIAFAEPVSRMKSLLK